MTLLKVVLALVASGALALLALGAMHLPSPPSAPELQAPTQGQSAEWMLQIDAPTLSQNLNAWAASQGTIETAVGTARLHQLTAEIHDNEVVVRGTADAGWLSLPVEAAATASVENGTIQMQVKQARVNGVDLPEAARRELEQQLQSQIQQSVDVYHVVVRSARLENGTLVLAGTRP